MKTIKMALIFVLTIFSISCEKEEIEAISNFEVEESIPGITSDGKMLIFESVESYESVTMNRSGEEIEAIISQNSSLQFNNYFSNHSAPVDTSEQEMDEVFGQLLNEDGVIQIGEHVYKIDMTLEQVFVISVADKETSYQELISGNTDSEKVLVYSFDDDVFQLVNEGINEKCSGVGSGKYWSYGAIHEAPIINTLDDGTVFRLNPFVRYFKAGIFFKLSSGYEIWKFGSAGSIMPQDVSGNLGLGLTNIEVFCRYPQGWYKRKPCGGGHIGTQAGGYYYSASTYNHKRTFYSGIRGLNGYHFYVQARAKYTGGLVSIATLYAGRNINSPY
jgi:hypothetical protein